MCVEGGGRVWRVEGESVKGGGRVWRVEGECEGSHRDVSDGVLLTGE